MLEENFPDQNKNFTVRSNDPTNAKQKYEKNVFANEISDHQR